MAGSDVVDSFSAAQESHRASDGEVTASRVKRALLSSILLVIASVFLYVLAIFAYILFYRNYLPDQVTALPIHLQYGYGDNPYAIAFLEDKNLKQDQPYDVTVSLTLPHSPANLERGNFMVALYLLDRDGTAPAETATQTSTTAGEPPALPYSSTNPPWDPRRVFARRRVMFASTRPVLAPYADPLVSLAKRILFMPFYLVFPSAGRWRLHVTVAEPVTFGRVLPSALFLEVQAGQTLQVYDASVTLTARLAGLRWFMVRHSTLAFLTLTTAFWVWELATTVVVWLLLTCLGGASPGYATLSRSTTRVPGKYRDSDEEGGEDDKDLGLRRVKSEGVGLTGAKSEEYDEDKMNEFLQLTKLPDVPTPKAEPGVDDEDEEGSGPLAEPHGAGQLRRRR